MSLTTTQRRNVELVSRFMEVMNDGGIEAVEAELETLTHPGVEWTPGMLQFDKGSYKGREELRQYIQTVLTVKPGRKTFINVDELRPVGEDGVLVLAWVHYSDPGNPPFDSEYALVIGIEDDQLKSLRSFLSHHAAEASVANA